MSTFYRIVLSESGTFLQVTRSGRFNSRCGWAYFLILPGQHLVLYHKHNFHPSFHHNVCLRFKGYDARLAYEIEPFETCNGYHSLRSI